MREKVEPGYSFENQSSNLCRMPKSSLQATAGREVAPSLGVSVFMVSFSLVVRARPASPELWR